jgi:hypothetical protein
MVVTDTLFKNRNELEHVVLANKKVAFINIHLNQKRMIKFIGLVWIMIIFVTMVYGPIAAFLVEMFPTRIRYTSMSLPYHIGNGIFGGLTPFIATLLTTINTQNKLAGLAYPILVSIVSLIIGVLYIRNYNDVELNAN